MARRMNCNEFGSFEKSLSEEKAAEESGAGADRNCPIPPGVYYLLSETSVLLLSEKSCSKLQ